LACIDRPVFGPVSRVPVEAFYAGHMHWKVLIETLAGGE
jgi:hypothetical protein